MEQLGSGTDKEDYSQKESLRTAASKQFPPSFYHFSTYRKDNQSNRPLISIQIHKIPRLLLSWSARPCPKELAQKDCHQFPIEIRLIMMISSFQYDPFIVTHIGKEAEAEEAC